MCSNLNLKCAAANEAYKPQTVDQRGGPTCGWCPVRISFLLFIAHFDGGHIENVDVSGVGGGIFFHGFMPITTTLLV